jgi:hypothetical protein
MTMGSAGSVLMGAVAMASLVATLFFLRAWRRTRDALFALFALAFAVDAVTRFTIGLMQPGDHTETFFYIGRLVTYALIAGGIAIKNRPGTRGLRDRGRQP